MKGKNKKIKTQTKIMIILCIVNLLKFGWRAAAAKKNNIESDNKVLHGPQFRMHPTLLQNSKAFPIPVYRISKVAN
jgi:hypothetical protein